MATANMPKEASDTLDILSKEIERSKNDRKPTSRHRLAELITARTGMPFRDALDVVEAFCEKNAPAVPEYLAGEFAIFWLKALSIVNALVGVVCFYYSAEMFRAHKPMWPMLCVGTLFCGLAAFFWIKSLEFEVDRKRHRDD